MCKTKKKRSLPDEPSADNTGKKAQKTVSGRGIDRNQGTKCCVCNKTIIDQSASHDGEDAIFCEGECSNWMHRSCAGLSSSLFVTMTSSSKPFLCVYCVLSRQATEINELKTALKDITSKLEKISNSASVHTGNPAPTNSTNVQPASQTSPPVASTNAETISTKPHTYVSPQQDRKYNVLVFGVAEDPSESSHFA